LDPDNRKAVAVVGEHVFRSDSAHSTMIEPMSFAEDTLFPQSFMSTPSANEIALANGTKLADRPITLTGK
jgi:hypothetical protein